MTDQYQQLQNSKRTQYQYQNEFFLVLASAYPLMTFSQRLRSHII